MVSAPALPELSRRIQADFDERQDNGGQDDGGYDDGGGFDGGGDF